MKNLKNPYAQNFVARFTWCLTNRHRYMIFTLKNNFWWYFIIKKTYLAKKGHFTAILRQLTDQKMPQSGIFWLNRVTWFFIPFPNTIGVIKSCKRGLKQWKIWYSKNALKKVAQNCSKCQFPCLKLFLDLSNIYLNWLKAKDPWKPLSSHLNMSEFDEKHVWK